MPCGSISWKIRCIWGVARISRSWRKWLNTFQNAKNKVGTPRRVPGTTSSSLQSKRLVKGGAATLTIMCRIHINPYTLKSSTIRTKER